MKNNKKILLIVLLLSLFFISISFVYAAVSGPQETLAKGFQMILTIFKFNWLMGSNLIAFLRVLMWITIFCVFYSAGQVVFGRMYNNGAKGAANRNAIMIALIFATSTTIFTPSDLLTTIYSSYSAVVMFVLFAIPIGLLIYIIYPALGKIIAPGWGLRLARIAGLILIWWILYKITTFADVKSGVISFNSIILLPIIYKLMEKKE